MELVIDELDTELLQEDLLLSARFGSVRRQVVASRALGQSLLFPKVAEGKEPQTIRFDLLSRTDSAWVVLRPGDDRYEVSFKGAEWKAPRSLTVRTTASPAGSLAEGCSSRIASPAASPKHAATSGATNGASFGLGSGGTDKAKSMAQDAKDYLEQHQIVGFFHALLHTVIRERPLDPYEFMSAQFPRNLAEAAERLPLVEEIKRLRAKNDILVKEVEELRRRNRDLQSQVKEASSGPITIANGADAGSPKGKSVGTSGFHMSLHRRPTILDESRETTPRLGGPSGDASPCSASLQVSLMLQSESMPRRVVTRSCSSSTLLLPSAESLMMPEGIPSRGSKATVSFTAGGAAKADDQAINEGLDKFWARLRGEGNAEDEVRVFRQSVTTGRWTLYCAGGKATKPSQYASKRAIPRVTEIPRHEPRCPFCVGNEHKTPDPLLAFDELGNECDVGELPVGWRVRVIPNIFPLLVTPPGLYDESYTTKLKNIPHSAVAEGKHQNFDLAALCAGSELDDGRTLFRQVNAVGYSEVIVENHQHNGLLAIVSAEQVALGLRALQSRGRVLVRRPGVRQLMYFKQYGALSGGSLVHPHMQVVTLPLLTPETQNRLSRALTYHARFGTCAVCQAHIRETSGSGVHSARLVHESKHFIVVVPFASNQYRVSLVPKNHSPSWLGISREEVEDMAATLQLVMEGIYRALDDPEYNIYIFSMDNEQEVGPGRDAVHWVLEIHPRFPAELGGMELASGIRVISGLPEDWAQTLSKTIRGLLAEREVANRPAPKASPHYYA